MSKQIKMANDISIGDEKQKFSADELSPFLFVDSGEQLVEEIQNVKEELHKKVLSVITKVDLLWEVIRTVIVFIIPMVSCLGLSFLSQFYLPGCISVLLTTVFISITIGLTFLNLTPLNEAIMAFQDFRIYSPKFLECSCKTCDNMNNCSKSNNMNNCSKSNEVEIPTDDIHNQQETITAQSDDLDGSIEQPDNSVKNFPTINQFVNENIVRRLDRSSSTEKSVFRETTSFLESSFNSQSNDKIDEDELDID